MLSKNFIHCNFPTNVLSRTKTIIWRKIWKDITCASRINYFAVAPNRLWLLFEYHLDLLHHVRHLRLWWGRGFPIFRQVMDTSIWSARDTHDPASDQWDRTPAIAAPRNLWLSTVRCPVDLATKANPCLRIENTSKNKEELQLNLRIKIKFTSWGLTNRWTATLFDDRINLSKTHLI